MRINFSTKDFRRIISLETKGKNERIILKCIVISPAALQPRFQSASKNIPESKGRSAHKADNLLAICELTVRKIWEPRLLTTLWASTAVYRDRTWD
jgi:hypothetical protein